MPHKLITSLNLSEGLHIPFIYANEVTNGLFVRLMLFALWTIVTLGLYFNQKRSTGTGDFPVGAATGSFVTVIVTVIFRLVPGLVDSLTLAIVMIIAVASVFMLLFTKRQ